MKVSSASYLMAILATHNVLMASCFLNSQYTSGHDTMAMVTSLKSSKRQLSTSTKLDMSTVEESEWYVPPPAPPKQPPAPKLPKGTVPQTRTIETEAQLMEFLAEDDRLCLVRFHATWCKSCQKFGLKFDKLAAQKADWIQAHTGEVVRKNQVRIASIEWTKSQKLAESLGVTKLPTIFFYAKGKKLTDMAVGASKFSKVRDAVEQYASFSPPELDFAAQMEAGSSLIHTVLKPATNTEQITPQKDAVDPLEALKATLATSAASTQSIARAKPAPRRKWWLERKQQQEAPTN